MQTRIIPKAVHGLPIIGVMGSGAAAGSGKAMRYGKPALAWLGQAEEIPGLPPRFSRTQEWREVISFLKGHVDSRRDT